MALPELQNCASRFSALFPVRPIGHQLWNVRPFPPICGRRSRLLRTRQEARATDWRWAAFLLDGRDRCRNRRRIRRVERPGRGDPTWAATSAGRRAPGQRTL